MLRLIETSIGEEASVADSVLDAIRNGFWDYEPEPVSEERFECTRALPGTSDKIDTLATRAIEGLPLWHSGDRLFYDDGDDGTC